jgi:hypothetical protein
VSDVVEHVSDVGPVEERRRLGRNQLRSFPDQLPLKLIDFTLHAETCFDGLCTRSAGFSDERVRSFLHIREVATQEVILLLKYRHQVPRAKQAPPMIMKVFAGEAQ